MSKTNTAPEKFAERTYEGAAAARMTPEQALRRSVMACLLWEDTFYEDGVAIAERIATLAWQVDVQTLAALAVEARTKMNLRHAPLWLLVSLIARQPKSSLVGDTIEATIQRADEAGELLSLYWKAGKRPLAKQLQKGLARAFPKFDAYQLAKYNRDEKVKMRDVLFLSHAKPRDDAQAALWKQLIAGTLASPDTWEVALSAGADKRETFERLLREQKLGYLALLRNLRNMDQAGVDSDLVVDAILARRGAQRVLPFRYVAAARAAPRYEPALDAALAASLGDMPALPGKTIVLVDVSGSMDAKLSGKSDMNRIDAAATLASIIPGDVRVLTFSNNVVETPPRKGMAGVDAIKRSQPHGGTELWAAVQVANQLAHDRLIVITDEQATGGYGGWLNRQRVAPKAPLAYMINVAAYKNGVGYGDAGWLHIDGFSEHVLRWIAESEAA